MSVLGLITSFPPYLRSTMVRFPLLMVMGNHTIADLRYEEKEIISPSTLIFAPIKG